MRLHQNVGNPDRIIRILVGLAFAAGLAGGIVSGPLAYLVGILAAILLVTGATGFCPLYAVFRISTRPARA